MMSLLSRFSLLALCLSVVLFAASGCAGDGASDLQSGKIKIERLDDLPRHTYAVTGKVTDLVLSSEKVLALAEAVRADVESDLETYEIGDSTTLKKMYSALLQVHTLKGEDKAVLALVDRIGALEEKEAARLLNGLVTRTIIEARRSTGSEIGTGEFAAAFRKLLAEEVSGLPWEAVQDTIESSKGQLEIYSRNLLLGVIQAEMEPIVARTGELSSDQATSLIAMFNMITRRLPLKDIVIDVYGKAIARNKVEKPDIWAARSVAFSGNEGYEPVLIAVWDSGTDCSVFQDCLFVNAAETEDGADTDGNGFVDDVHGIAYDIHAKKTTGLLYPLGDAADRMPSVMNHLKGLMDLQAAIGSPEASALKRHLSGIEPARVQGFIEDLGLAGNYAHGTHVAGIMLEGNSFARLLVARLSYDYHSTPVARTVEWGERDAAKCRDTADYFARNGVRVVNMSWGEAQGDAVASLESNGIGESAEERREIARKVFALQKDGLHDAIARASDVLFVCAAGNSDNDVEFDDNIPSSFDLPNLLVVGAVDQAGDPTSFTSFGRTVEVYANGFEVMSYVPGGARMKMSGTSMASPNAANLAAKLVAAKPALTPSEVIALIKKGADRKKAGEREFLLMNPKRSLGLLK
jgi:subtilisin family serine protease